MSTEPTPPPPTDWKKLLLEAGVFGSIAVLAGLVVKRVVRSADDGSD